MNNQKKQKNKFVPRYELKMTSSELADICQQLYGEYGWQTALAKSIGVDSSSVRRWVSGAVPIPGPVIAAVKCFHKNLNET